MTTPPAPRPGSRLVPAILGIGLFLIYTAGACPTIYVGDSGELVTAVYVLGIPHPSGYPLYVLVGKLWTLALPVGSIAYRMSLMSAACAAAACVGIFAACRRAGLTSAAAAFAGLAAAFGPSFWAEANVQRVYGLNAVAVALATVSAFSWHRDRRPRWLILAFLICGVGATNHTFMAVYAVALATFAVLVERSLLRRPGPLLAGAAAFAVGLLPYVYLPLRSRADPPLDWGNPETLSATIAVVLRRDFWDRAWLEGPKDLVPISLDYLRSLGPELLWAGAPLAVLGVLIGRRRGWPVLLPLLVMAGNFAAVALHGSRSDIFIWHRYYIPSYLMGAVLAGMGGQALMERLPRNVRLLPLALPLLTAVVTFHQFDRSRYVVAEDFSRTLLETLPPGVHLAANDDNILFVLMYLHLVEGMRPDVDLILQGVGGAELPPLHFDPDSDPLFLTHDPNWRIAGLRLVPVGLVFQTVREGRLPPPPALSKERLDGEDDPRVPKDYLTRNLIGQFHYMLGLTFQARDWPRAWREFAVASAAAPDNDVLFFNLGLIFRENGLLPEALAAFERSDAINPRVIPGPGRARAADRMADVRRDLAALQETEGTLSARATRAAACLGGSSRVGASTPPGMTVVLGSAHRGRSC